MVPKDLLAEVAALLFDPASRLMIIMKGTAGFIALDFSLLGCVHSINRLIYIVFILFPILYSLQHYNHSTMQEENPTKKAVESDNESEWSLASLEDLKGLDLKDIKEHDEGNQPKPKENKKVNVVYPQEQKITTESQLYCVGKVISKVGELFIIEVTNHSNIVDLDNWLFNEERQIIGFVIDVFGRVDQPFYALKLKQGISESIEIIGKNLYFADGCKTLTEDDIKSIQAKNSVDFAADDSSDEQEGQLEGYSQPFLPEHRVKERKRSFDEPPVNERERTREKRQRPQFEERNRQNHQGRTNNQAYLESMYSNYYAQMMSFYQQGIPLPPMPPQNFNYPPHFQTGTPMNGPGNQFGGQMPPPNMQMPPPSQVPNMPIPPPSQASNMQIPPQQFGANKAPQHFPYK